MTSAIARVFEPYAAVRKHIIDADVLMYAGRGVVSNLIKIAGLSDYSHAGMAGWTNGAGYNPDNPYNRLMAYEMLWRGGQGTTLSSHVDKWPNTIDVYRVSDTHTRYTWDPMAPGMAPFGKTLVLDRKFAVALMRDFCRPGEYGKFHLFLSALAHVPILRLFYRPPLDDELEDRKRPPYCSEALSYALRKAFTDVVMNMPDHYTAPGALARSPLLHYMFTLASPKQLKEKSHATSYATPRARHTRRAALAWQC